MTLNSWEIVTGLLIAIGGGAGVSNIIKFLISLFSGRAGRQRSEVDRAWDRADREARKRRRIEEHASLLTRMLIESPCVEADKIPQFPSYGPWTDQLQVPQSNQNESEN